MEIGDIFFRQHQTMQRVSDSYRRVFEWYDVKTGQLSEKGKDRDRDNCARRKTSANTVPEVGGPSESKDDGAGLEHKDCDESCAQPSENSRDVEGDFTQEDHTPRNLPGNPDHTRLRDLLESRRRQRESLHENISESCDSEFRSRKRTRTYRALPRL